MRVPILIDVTRRPQALSTTPILLAVTPLPRPLTTPPVTRTYFILTSTTAAQPQTRNTLPVMEAGCRTQSTTSAAASRSMPPSPRNNHELDSNYRLNPKPLLRLKLIKHRQYPEQSIPLTSSGPNTQAHNSSQEICLHTPAEAMEHK